MGELLRILLGGAVSGGVIGAIAVWIVPGKQYISKVETVAVGSVAGVVGGWVAELFGLVPDTGIAWWQLAFQVGFAAVGVLIYLKWRDTNIPAIGQAQKAVDEASQAVESVSEGMGQAIGGMKPSVFATGNTVEQQRFSWGPPSPLDDKYKNFGRG